jgi:hypothetical protein
LKVQVSSWIGQGSNYLASHFKPHTSHSPGERLAASLRTGPILRNKANLWGTGRRELQGDCAKQSQLPGSRMNANSLPGKRLWGEMQRMHVRKQSQFGRQAPNIFPPLRGGSFAALWPPAWFRLPSLSKALSAAGAYDLSCWWLQRDKLICR